MTSRIVAAIALALLCIGGAAAIDAAETQSSDGVTVTNESFTPDAGNYTELDRSNMDGVRYDERVDVYNQSGIEMYPTEDYAWNQTNGTVKTIENGSLDGETQADITYGYVRPTPLQEDLAALFGSGFEVVGLLVFVLVVFAILAAMRSFA